MATYDINQLTLPNGDVCNFFIPITNGGTGASTAEDAKANLGLGTSDMNLKLITFASGTAIQQWGIRAKVVNPNNTYYGNRTGLYWTDSTIQLGSWDANDNYVGAVWQCPTIPASDTNSGYVTTGNQTFSGQKRFTGSLAQYPGVTFTAANDTLYDSSVFLNRGTTADNKLNNPRIAFEVRGADSSQNPTAYFERYRLPAVANGITATEEYDIITTKNQRSLDYVSATHLASGTNVDTGLEYGVTYYVSDATEAAGLTGDLPFTTSGFKIIQFRSYNSTITYSKQFILTSTHKIYMRQRTSTTAWSSWLYFQPVRFNTTVTLSSGSWSSNTQSVTVTGLTANDDVFVSAAPASVTTYRQNGVYCSSQAANTLTFTCATTPTTNITVNVRAYG